MSSISHGNAVGSFDLTLASARLPNLNPNPLQQRPLQEFTPNGTQFKVPLKFRAAENLKSLKIWGVFSWLRLPWTCQMWGWWPRDLSGISCKQLHRLSVWVWRGWSASLSTHHSSVLLAGITPMSPTFTPKLHESDVSSGAMPSLSFYSKVW